MAGRLECILVIVFQFMNRLEMGEDEKSGVLKAQEQNRIVVERLFVQIVNLCDKGYANQGDIKDILSIILVGWEMCRSGGCTDKVIRTGHPLAQT